jgi:Spy/CpxP family protein refolding chaperone
MISQIQNRRRGRILATGTALAAALLMAAPARAQQTAPHAAQEHQEHSAQHLDQVMAHMTSELHLTADQATRIRGIMERTMEQFQSVHAAHASGGHQGGPPAEARALHDRAMQQVEEVLTPDQRTRFRAMVEHMHNGEHAGHGAHAAPPRS